MGHVVIPNRPKPSDLRDINAILADFDAITTVINGELDSSNFSQVTASSLGLNTSEKKAKGVSVIPTEQGYSSNTYGLLSTPDEVSVFLPENGLILIWFQAVWKESVNTTASARIALNGTEIKMADLNEANPLPGTTATIGGNTVAGTFKPLVSATTGLFSSNALGGSSSYVGDVTTGQVVGMRTFVPTIGSPAQSAVISTGVCAVFAAAGIYKVEIQFKTTSGVVSVKGRKLWVRAESFQ